MRLRTKILLGSASFLAGLLLLAPAASLYGWLKTKDQPAAYELFGLQGTLSSGSLSGLSVDGRPILGDLRWRLQPLGLLLGRASFHIEGGGQTVVNGRFSTTLLGTQRLQNFIATGSIKPLLAAIGQAFLPVEGQARLDLKHLKLRNGLAQSVEGEIQIQNLAWTLAREPLQLGDYLAQLSTENGDSLISIQSVSGPLELSGSGRLTADQTYELELKLRPKPEAPPLLRNLVSGAGAPDVQGNYRIRQHGKLVP